MKDKKKNKKKQSKYKINFTSLFISLFIIFLTILVNEATPIRPIMWLLAIILLTINILTNCKPKAIYGVFIFLVVLIISFVVDGLTSIAFNHIPVFTYNITNVGKTRVYNSIGLRIWQCDKANKEALIVDLFYNNGYMCDAEDIDVLDSNSFLNSIVANYSEYKNKYIKIKGKISKKTGQNYIEMQPYENSTNALNGHAIFADNITLRIFFKNKTEELDNYDVYDEIIIVGVIKNLDSSNSKYYIYMDEAKIVSNINLNEYSLTITKEKTCTEQRLIHSNLTNNVYTYCLQDIIVTYPNIHYDLASALSSNKLQLEELYSNPLEEIPSEDDDSRIYRFSDYSILICDPTISKDVIIGEKKMTFDKVTCNRIVEQ